MLVVQPLAPEQVDELKSSLGESLAAAGIAAWTSRLSLH